MLTMSRHLSEPQPFGRRLLPQVVDFYAVTDPERLFGLFAIPVNLSMDFRQVRMREIASAVNYLAWWIKDRIGISEQFETVAYLGASDFLYPIFCLAAIKCGFKVILRT